MADDVFANIAALYEQQRILEERQGPRICEIRACGDALAYLVHLLDDPGAPVPNGLGALASLSRISLVRDDELPDYLVRLVHADGSKRDVVIHAGGKPMTEGWTAAEKELRDKLLDEIPYVLGELPGSLVAAQLTLKVFDVLAELGWAKKEEAAIDG